MQIPPLPLTSKEESLHARAQTIARHYLRGQGEMLSLIDEIDRCRLFEKFHLRSAFSYCLKHLGLSEDVATAFLRVARLSRKLPALGEAVRAGLPHSKAKRIAPLLTKENHLAWIQKAQECSFRQLEVEIAKACPQAATPERLTAISPTHFSLSVCLELATAEKLRRVQDLLASRQRAAPSLARSIDAALDEFLKRQDPLKQAENARKPDLLHHAVFRRDRGMCQAVHADGTPCQEIRWLDIHHKLPKSEGGKDELENLILLCSQHHRMFHKSNVLLCRVS